MRACWKYTSGIMRSVIYRTGIQSGKCCSVQATYADTSNMNKQTVRNMIHVQEISFRAVDG